MRYNLLHWFGVGLLAATLTACDNSDSGASAGNNTATQSATQQAVSGQQVSIVDGQLNFLLPVDMSDQTGTLGDTNNNLHVYSDASGGKVMLVIVSADTKDALDVMASRLEMNQRQRDPQLQVITSHPVQITGHSFWRFDSVISDNNKVNYSGILFGRLDKKLVTMQVTLPDYDDNNHQAPQKMVQEIFDTLVLK